MQRVTFERTIGAETGRAFGISTDYANLHEITNGFYTSVRIKSSRQNSTLAEHKINIMGMTLSTMVKHVTEEPYVHVSYWVGGDAKGGIIRETYEKSGDLTLLRVDASLKLPLALAAKSKISPKKLESCLRRMADGIADAAES